MGIRPDMDDQLGILHDAVYDLETKILNIRQNHERQLESAELIILAGGIYERYIMQTDCS